MMSQPFYSELSGRMIHDDLEEIPSHFYNSITTENIAIPIIPFNPPQQALLPGLLIPYSKTEYISLQGSWLDFLDYFDKYCCIHCYKKIVHEELLQTLNNTENPDYDPDYNPDDSDNEESWTNDYEENSFDIEFYNSNDDPIGYLDDGTPIYYESELENTTPLQSGRVDENGNIDWNYENDNFEEYIPSKQPLCHKLIENFEEIESFKKNFCAICQDEMINFLELPCGHIFHKDCISNWLYTSATCPTCRFFIETDNCGECQPCKTRLGISEGWIMPHIYSDMPALIDPDDYSDDYSDEDYSDEEYSENEVWPPVENRINNRMNNTLPLNEVSPPIENRINYRIDYYSLYPSSIISTVTPINRLITPSNVPLYDTILQSFQRIFDDIWENRITWERRGRVNRNRQFDRNRQFVSHRLTKVMIHQDKIYKGRKIQRKIQRQRKNKRNRYRKHKHKRYHRRNNRRQRIRYNFQGRR
jgi:hypothetical protein